jgi:large subunit ribosomal protein L32e
MTKKPDTKKLLEVRKSIKSKKPEFLQQDFHKKSRLARKWKRPTGLQSKMRHQLKGYRRRVKQGWRSPQPIRGFDSKGYAPVIVSNVKDLANLKENQGVVVSSTVGLKKKIAILEKAVQLKLVVLNLKLDAVKKMAEDLKAKNTELRKSKQDKKSLDDALKKADKKKEEATPAEPVTEDEKKAEEKKEKDEVLIHKQ